MPYIKIQVNGFFADIHCSSKEKILLKYVMGLQTKNETIRYIGRDNAIEKNQDLIARLELLKDKVISIDGWTLKDMGVK